MKNVYVDMDGSVRYTTMMGGALRARGADAEMAKEMFLPVLCECGSIYDQGTVTVTARYSDCSVWKTPCCKRECDDRPPGWKSGPSYQRIDKKNLI